MPILEENFKLGKISISELAQERSRRTTALVRYQEGKASLHSAITLLELLTNIKIINK